MGNTFLTTKGGARGDLNDGVYTKYITAFVDWYNQVNIAAADTMIISIIRLSPDMVSFVWYFIRHGGPFQYKDAILPV